MSHSLGTLAITANKPAIFQAPNEGIKGILIGNESGLTVTITMESGGVQKTLYPSMLDWYAVNPGFTGNIKIAPAVILNNVTSFPASSLVFDAIGLNDSENASMYPVHMPRNTNIGNGINVGTQAISVVNDGNVGNTTIVEATVSGDGSSAVMWTNDAVLKNGDAAHPGSVSFDNAKITSDGAGKLTVTGDLHVQGNIYLDTNNTAIYMKDDGGSTRLILSVNASGELIIQQAGTGKKIYIQNNIGSHMASFATAGAPGGSTFDNAGGINANTTP
jgi:hypothetical protein